MRQQTVSHEGGRDKTRSMVHLPNSQNNTRNEPVTGHHVSWSHDRKHSLPIQRARYGLFENKGDHDGGNYAGRPRENGVHSIRDCNIPTMNPPDDRKSLDGAEPLPLLRIANMSWRSDSRRVLLAESK